MQVISFRFQWSLNFVRIILFNAFEMSLHGPVLRIHSIIFFISFQELVHDHEQIWLEFYRFEDLILSVLSRARV